MLPYGFPVQPAGIGSPHNARTVRSILVAITDAQAGPRNSYVKGIGPSSGEEVRGECKQLPPLWYQHTAHHVEGVHSYCVARHPGCRGVS